LNSENRLMRTVCDAWIAGEAIKRKVKVATNLAIEVAALIDKQARRIR